MGRGTDTGKDGYAAAIVRAVQHPLVVLTADLRVETANPAFYDRFRVAPAESEGRLVYELGNGQWDIPELRRLLEEMLPANRRVGDFRVEHEFEHIGLRVMLLTADRVRLHGTDDRILLAIRDITAEEKARWELEAQKEYAEKIVDASRESLLILDRELRVKTANQTFYTTFRVDPAETEGRLVYELGNGQWDIPGLRRALEHVLPENNAFDDYEIEHDFEDIGCRVMLLNGRRIDHMHWILLAIEDVTDRRAAEGGLRESEARLSAILEHAPVGIGMIDSDGRWIFTNPVLAPQATTEIIPSRNDEAARDWQAFDADGRPVPREQWPGNRALRGEVTAPGLDFRKETPDGERWVRVTAAPVPGDGASNRAILIMEDIAPHKRTEERLRASEQRLQRVLETDTVGVLFFDKAGRLIQSNESFLRMAGYTRDDVASGRIDWRSMTPPEWMDVTNRQMERLARTGRIGPYEKEYFRSDGTRSWLLLAGRDLGDGTMVKFAIDIDDRKRAEAALRASEARLSVILEHAPVGIGAFDTAGRWVFANPFLADLAEHEVIPSQDPAMAGHWHAFDRDGHPLAQSDWPGARALRGEVTSPGIDFKTDALGDERWFRVAAAPVPDAGAGGRALLILQDVSEQKRVEQRLRESEAQLSVILEYAPVGIALVGEGGRWIFVNRTIAPLATGDRMPSQEAEAARGWHAYDADGRPVLPQDWPGARALRGEVAAQGMDFMIDTAGGRQWWRAAAAPVPSGTGARHLVLIMIEMTEQRQAAERLRRSEERLSLALDAAGQIGTWDWDLVTDVLRADARFAALFRIPPDEAAAGIAHEVLARALHPDDLHEVRETVLRTAGSGGDYSAEYRVIDEGGSERWVLARGRCLLDAAGRPVRFPGVVLDITDRKRSEERLRLLMAELDHRVKNVLAVVQSITRRSLGDEESDAAERLVGRLTALSQSHNLLAEARWQGADLRRLIEQTFAPYVAEESGRIDLDGPALGVTPRAAQSLTLALHELVTNAAKYGALSVPDGRVEVAWALVGAGEGGGDEGRLDLTWRETGGPPVRPPAERGFGSRLIEQTIAYELDGSVETEFAPGGFTARFVVPLAAFLSGAGRPRSASAGNGARRPAGNSPRLEGRRVLVVEDQQLVAEDVATALRDAGCEVVGPVASLADAERAARAEGCDAAVLDINLNGHMVWPLARELRCRAVPIVFATGYSGAIEAPAGLRDAPRLAKPIDPAELVSTLSALLQDADTASAR